jgi:predicted secreted Zn-dependent protease
MLRAAVLAVAAGVCLVGSAEASVEVKVKTISYRISGENGEALLRAMDRKGPKQGFTTRFLAQTAYKAGWKFDWQKKAGACRIANALAVLTITYTYPEVSSPMSADLRHRWNRFIVGVRKHEQTHGRIAREMVAAAERQLSGLSYRNDPGCQKTRAEVKRRIASIYSIYVARQAEFDRVEHAEGGNVKGLVSLLSRAGR